MFKSFVRPCKYCIWTVGLLFLGLKYGEWIIENDLLAVKTVGLAASFAALVPFAIVCVVLVSRMFSFRADEAELIRTDRKALSKTEIKIFISFLLLSFFYVCSISLLRKLSGSGDAFLADYSMWKTIDSYYYFDIAENWYFGESFSGSKRLVFFPFYPIIVGIFANILGVLASSLFVSAICYASSAVILYRLIALEYDTSSALRSLKYFAILPGAFFFAIPMSEALFSSPVMTL